MQRSELFFLGALAVFAGATLMGSIDMPFMSGVTFGPGFLPLIMSVAILGLAVLICIRAYVTRKIDAAESAAEVEPAGNIGAVIAAVALIAGTVAAASLGSLLVSLGVCMILVNRMLLHRSWVVSVGATLATIAAIYAIFGLWLHIPIT